MSERKKSIANTANRMFDILDVNLLVPRSLATNAYLVKISASLGADFMLEALDLTGPKMLRVRIICVDTECPTIDAIETAIREVADAEHFKWQRFGGVPAGNTVTMHC